MLLIVPISNINISHLFGGFNSSEKYEFVTWDDEISNCLRNKYGNHVPVTTNQMLTIINHH